MNRLEVTTAIKQLAENIRKELNQTDGSVYMSENDWNPMVVKFSIVREGKVKVFNINVWEESL